MKKIVIFHNYESPYRNKLFNEISKYYDLTVCFLQTKESEKRKWEITEEVKFRKINISYRMNFKFVINNINDIKNLLKENYFRVVITDNFPNFLTMKTVLKYVKNKDKLILWSEDSNFFKKNLSFPKKLLYEYINRYFLKRTKKIAVFNKASYVYYKKKYSGKDIFFVPQATSFNFDIKKIKIINKCKGTLKLGFLGQINKRKNVKGLIENVIKLKNNYPSSEIKLLIAGNGNLLKKFKAQYYGKSYIIFLGYINKKDDFFKKIDFLVLPSFYDTWGMVVNEALEYGKPCIVSTGANSRELILKEYVFNINSKDSFYKVLEKALLLEKDEYRKICNYYLKKIQLYSIENSAKHFFKAFER